MKTALKVMVAAAGIGVGAWALNKYNPKLVDDIKNSFKNMNKNATKSIENMM